MKRFLVAIAVALLASGGAIGPAWAGHGHGGGHAHVGVYVAPTFGWGWYSPWYYPYPYSYPYSYSYYYPPYTTSSSPPVYIEQGQPATTDPSQPGGNDWYYCHSPEGYYPYVKQCPGGWQRVPSQPQQ